MRKKTISLLVVLTFLMTLFPLALPAFAADYSRMGAVVAVDDDDVFPLNRVRMEFDAGELEENASVLISLPNGFEFRDDDDSDSDVMVDDDWLAEGADNYFSVTEGTATVDVTMLADNEIKLEVSEIGTGDVTLMLNLGAIYIDEDFEGDIPLEFYSAKKGFDDGSVVVGRVTGGEVKVTVTDDEAFGDGGGDVTLRLREDRAGAFDVDAESVKITLPRGFEWDEYAGDVEGEKSGDYYAWLVDGDADTIVGNVYFRIDKDELILDTSDAVGTTDEASIIEIKARIIVEDETRAKAGDVVAKVGGESDVTPATIVVGTYGDFEVEVSADDPTTVYAGYLEQEIADITFEETIGDSLVDGRSVTLTLPEWAKWGALDGRYNDGSKAGLDTLTFPGKDGRVAKYVVDGGNTSAAEIDLEDMEVVLSPEAPEGDLEVEIAGSAGVKATVKVAEVKKPVAVEVDVNPVIGIGKADQAIGVITLTEAEAELIIQDKDLVLELPKDVDWDEFDVEVTDGDLELGRFKADDNLLVIPIDRDSSEASTITVTASVTAYRSVPEGRVVAEVGGDAVIEVNDYDAIEDYYDYDYNYDLYVGGAVAIADREWDEGLFADDDTIAKVQVATVGTPAPGEQKITAIFTLGSTNYVLNGEDQTMDVAPYAKNGRTYLPMRYVATALGIPSDGILWHNGTATFISAERVVSVTIGSNVMYINGAAVVMDVAPEISNGRTMLPIRWIATAFGVSVDWDAETQKVTVNP